MSSIIQKINATLKRVNDPVIRERLLMVKASHKMPLRDVVRDFSCTHGKAAYWKNMYSKQGLKGLYTKERSGRPSKLKPEQTAIIRRRVRKHNIKQGWTTKHIREETRSKNNNNLLHEVKRKFWAYDKMCRYTQT